MTIEEAIKLIQEDRDNEDVDWDSPLGKAYKLSFNALQRIMAIRKHQAYSVFPSLSGETKK